MTDNNDKAFSLLLNAKDEEKNTNIEDVLDFLCDEESINAYSLAQQTWQDEELLRDDPMVVDIGQEFAHLDTTSSTDNNTGADTPSAPHPGFFGRHQSNAWRTGLGLAATVCGLAIYSIVGYFGVPSEHQASVNDNYQLSLEDHSQIILENKTKVKISEGWGRRRVELDSGSAYFAVSKNKKKPFEVISNNVTTTVLGTNFSVSNHTGEVHVVVEDGFIVENVSG
jgi:ferric-dicitrate binding protein FerR (iron transport regulator)